MKAYAVLTLSGLVLADEGRCPHPWVRKLEVLVEVVKAIEEVAHVSTEDREHSVIPVLANEAYKVHTHLVEELALRDAQHLIHTRKTYNQYIAFSLLSRMITATLMNRVSLNSFIF